MATSKQFALDAADFAKGALMAVLSPIVPIIIQSLSAGSLTFDWKAIATVALGAFMAYIGKNYFTPPASTSTSPIAK